MTHQKISFIKSAIRIAGYVLIWRAADFEEYLLALSMAGLTLIASELVGIYEEIGH